jgi:ERCC4-type nuclease
MPPCHPYNLPFFDHFADLKRTHELNGHSNKAHSCKTILESLSRYPLPISTRQQALALEGVGGLFGNDFERIINSLIERYQETPRQRGKRESLDWRDFKEREAATFIEQEEEFGDNSNSSFSGLVKRPRTIQASLPPQKGGMWVLLLGIYLFSRDEQVFTFQQGLSYAEKIRKIIPMCVKVTQKTFDSLFQREWIIKLTTSEYRLTPTGSDVASRLHRRCADLAHVNLTTISGESWKSVVLVDYREYSKGVNVQSLSEPRALALGDIVWIWKKSGEERFSGTLIERKTTVDLANSIIDGRYEEQKGRIMRTPGMQNVFFLIEGDLDKYRPIPGISRDALETALRSIQLINGFHVVKTKDIEKTSEKIDEFSQALTLPSNPSLLPTYEEFHVSAAKTSNLSKKDLFERMLLSFHGLGVEYVLAISAMLRSEFNIEEPSWWYFIKFLKSNTQETFKVKLKATQKISKSISTNTLQQIFSNFT